MQSKVLHWALRGLLGALTLVEEAISQPGVTICHDDRQAIHHVRRRAENLFSFAFGGRKARVDVEPGFPWREGYVGSWSGDPKREGNGPVPPGGLDDGD